jgi:hypothetical protein
MAKVVSPYNFPSVAELAYAVVLDTTHTGSNPVGRTDGSTQRSDRPS